MGEREIREKYGGKLAKAINRAIRAEVGGGGAALDRLTQLAGPALHSGWKDPKGKPTPEAAAYFKHQREVVDPMEAEIRARWGVPAGAGAARGPTTRPRPSKKKRAGGAGRGRGGPKARSRSPKKTGKWPSA